MFKVIKEFTDLQDDGHAYDVGDVYPREGLEVSEDRIASLSSSHNNQGVPLISVVKTAESLNPAIPAPLEKVEQDTPSKPAGRPRRTRSKN